MTGAGALAAGFAAALVCAAVIVAVAWAMRRRE